MVALDHFNVFIRSAENSSGKRNHKQLSNVPPSAVGGTSFGL